MKGLERKQELILEQERAFANALGAAVFDKPRISYWMVLLPILFLYFVLGYLLFGTIALGLGSLSRRPVRSASHRWSARCGSGMGTVPPHEEKRTGGFTVGSRHFFISECPSANEKPHASLW